MDWSSSYNSQKLIMDKAGKLITDKLNRASLYSEILQRNGINKEIENIEKLDGGQHCTSRCTQITIKFKDESVPSLQLFEKRSLTKEEKEDVSDMFEKEANFLNYLVPQLTQFSQQKHFPVAHFSMAGILPKTLYADNELIIQENLVPLGYTMLPEHVCHSLLEATKGIEALGKFHGLSYALIRIMGLDNFIKKYEFTLKSMSWSSAGKNVIGSWVERILNGVDAILSRHPVPKSEQVQKFLEKYKKNAFEIFCRHHQLKDQMPCGVVVNHGDCWNCNFLFKKNVQTQQIENCVLVDFQGIYVGSPTLDVQYYFFIAVQRDVRQKHWKHLLQIYYKFFTETVESLEGLVEFTFKDLVEDYKEKSESGFILALDPFYFFDTFGDPVKLEDILGTEKGHFYAQEIVKSFEQYQQLTNTL